DFDHESSARLAGDEGVRPGAGRTARPIGPRFDPRPTVRREPFEVDFVRRATVECGVRAVLVVPADDRSDGLGHGLGAQRDGGPAQMRLQRADRPLDDRDAAMLADRAEARVDAVAFAPALVAFRWPELRALVADQVFRRYTRGMDDSSEERPDID